MRNYFDIDFIFGLNLRHGRQHNVHPSNINFRANIHALKAEGCTHVIVTTACGSLQEKIHPGDIVLLDQFIDRTTKRQQTFYDGGADSPQGVCHIPMHTPFCPETRKVLLAFPDLVHFFGIHFVVSGEFCQQINWLWSVCRVIYSCTCFFQKFLAWVLRKYFDELFNYSNPENLRGCVMYMPGRKVLVPIPDVVSVLYIIFHEFV